MTIRKFGAQDGVIAGTVESVGVLTESIKVVKVALLHGVHVLCMDLVQEGIRGIRGLKHDTRMLAPLVILARNVYAVKSFQGFHGFRGYRGGNLSVQFFFGGDNTYNINGLKIFQVFGIAHNDLIATI